MVPIRIGTGPDFCISTRCCGHFGSSLPIDLAPLFVPHVPGVIRRVTGGEYSVPLAANVIWDRWLIAGMLGLLAMTYVCVRNLSAMTGATSP